MKYCKHLKKRKNKPYCNIIRKEITLSQCRECVDKEYKENNKKCTFQEVLSPKKVKKVKKMKIKSNNSQISNSAKTLQNSAKTLQNSAKTLHKMRNKSNKLAKLERNRFSVFTDDMDKCYFCDNPRMDKHEIYRGKNRTNSMKFGFVLPMCRFHHDMYQDDVLFNELWHKTAQKYFEEHCGTREDFIAIFRRNYLK